MEDMLEYEETFRESENNTEEFEDNEEEIAEQLEGEQYDDE